MARQSQLFGTGHVGVLEPYPEIYQGAADQLLALRRSGITVNRLLGRTIFIALIKLHVPDLLKTFKASEVKNFFELMLSNYSCRTGSDNVSRARWSGVFARELEQLPTSLQTGRMFVPRHCSGLFISFDSMTFHCLYL